MAYDGTKSNDIHVRAREVDFVTQFQANWEHLMDILGITRMIRKEPGTELSYKKAYVTLETEQVGEGEQVKTSKSEVREYHYKKTGVERYKTEVSIQAIEEHGYNDAVALTDEEFKNELTNKVSGEFYGFLGKGSLKGTAPNIKAKLALAKGAVINKFKKMHRTVTEVVGFVNVMDIYDYLAEADITIQTKFGFEYVENFLGYKTVFLLSDDEIAQGTVVATPVNNIICYFVDPGDSNFAKAGLEFTVQGETHLIGFHTEGDYDTGTSNGFALMGVTLMAEYVDGICVMTTGEKAIPTATKEITRPAEDEFVEAVPAEDEEEDTRS